MQLQPLLSTMPPLAAVATLFVVGMGVAALLLDKTPPSLLPALPVSVPSWLLPWLLCEGIFYIWLKRLRWKLNILTSPQSVRDPSEYLAHLLHVLDALEDVYPPEKFILTWCGATEKEHGMEHVKKGNVAAFLAYAFYSRDHEDLNEQEKTTLTCMVNTLEKHYSPRIKLEGGYNPALRSMRMTIEPLETFHWPLLAYLLIISLPRLLASAYLHFLGFRHKHTKEGDTYWYRGPSGSSTSLPLVFFHGISPGQCMYIGLLTLLARDRSATILVNIPHVAMSLEAFEAKDQAGVASLVESICDKHGINHFCVAAHSYGCIWAGWVIKSLPKRVLQAVLLEPVCLLLFLPTTQRNFIYRRPHDHDGGSCCIPSTSYPPPSLPPSLSLAGRGRHFLLDCIVHYVISREATVANAMRRHFWWHQKILLREDIHCPLTLGMGSCDRLLPGAAIKKYMGENKREGGPPDVQIDWWEGHCHGEFLLSYAKQKRLAERVRRQEETIISLREELMRKGRGETQQQQQQQQQQ